MNINWLDIQRLTFGQGEALTDPQEGGVMAKRIAIVNQGEGREVDRGRSNEFYDYFTRLLELELDSRLWPSLPVDTEVKVFEEVGEVEAWLGGEGFAVFVTGGMIVEADHLAEQSGVETVLFTLDPDVVSRGETVVVSKRLVLDREELRRLFFS